MNKDIYLALYKNTILGIFFEKRLVIDFMDSLYQNVNYNNEYLDYVKLTKGIDKISSSATLYLGGYNI